MIRLWNKIRSGLKRLLNSTKTTKVRLVDEKDAIELLNSMNELENLKKGHRKCVSCNKQITLENYSSFYKENNQYYFICDNYECLSKYLDK
jgi:hypothetical protein